MKLQKIFLLDTYYQLYVQLKKHLERADLSQVALFPKHIVTSTLS